MRIVLATRAFAWPGGSETYLLTVAEALERLGHSATIYCNEVGEAAELAKGRGVRVERSLSAIDECDAALAQDAPAAYELADRFPGAPLAFAGHSKVQLQTPPQLDGVCGAAVAMNDPIAAHLRSLAVFPEVVRLRQPVDRSRFGPLGLTRRRSRRVIAFGNNFPGSRERMIAAACEGVGYEFEVVGRRNVAGGTLHPERELGRAEIVIGIGRCAVEAMASGRGVYVYGLAGGDGWVTADTYATLEADGFSGRATPAAIGEERLAADLALFTPEMGRDNRDLANANHDSLDHGRELVELWRRLGASSPPPAPADELARMGRIQRQTEETAATFALESQMFRIALDDTNARLEELSSSRRYRIGSVLAWPFDAARRWRRRRANRVG